MYTYIYIYIYIYAFAGASYLSFSTAETLTPESSAGGRPSMAPPPPIIDK